MESRLKITQVNMHTILLRISSARQANLHVTTTLYGALCALLKFHSLDNVQKIFRFGKCNICESWELDKYRIRLFSAQVHRGIRATTAPHVQCTRYSDCTISRTSRNKSQRQLYCLCDRSLKTKLTYPQWLPLAADACHETTNKNLC